MSGFLEIGQIVNTFGIKGMVKVAPFTDDITRFDNLKNVVVVTRKERKTFEIEEVKYHKNMVLLKLEGVDKVEEAENLKNSYLEIERSQAGKLDEGTYYIVDILGLEVYTDNNQFLGKVDDIFNTGSNDIYVVKDEMGKQILLPAIKEVIQKIDLDNNKITVHLLKGLE